MDLGWGGCSGDQKHTRTHQSDRPTTLAVTTHSHRHSAHQLRPATLAVTTHSHRHSAHQLLPATSHATPRLSECAHGRPQTLIAGIPLFLYYYFLSLAARRRRDGRVQMLSACCKWRSPNKQV